MDNRVLQRRSIRLRGYDYSQAGAYFITICTQGRVCVLGEVVDGRMRLNELGKLTARVWKELPQHYAHVRLDAWVVMPNHVHGIVTLDDVGAGLKPAPTSDGEMVRHGIPEIVRGFKTFSARRINAVRGTVGTQFWQRNYFEHIIRDESGLDRIRRYIDENPLRWHKDPENPEVGAGLKPAPTGCHRVRRLGSHRRFG